MVRRPHPSRPPANPCPLSPARTSTVFPMVCKQTLVTTFVGRSFDSFTNMYVDRYLPIHLRFRPCTSVYYVLFSRRVKSWTVVLDAGSALITALGRSCGGSIECIGKTPVACDIVVNAGQLQGHGSAACHLPIVVRIVLDAILLPATGIIQDNVVNSIVEVEQAAINKVCCNVCG
jgi:hypothetical protein